MFSASLGFAASLVEEPAENQVYVKVIVYERSNVPRDSAALYEVEKECKMGKNWCKKLKIKNY